MRIGIWQDSGVLGDIPANLSIIKKSAQDAAKENVDILVFPECFLTGYFNETSFSTTAQNVTEDVVGILEDIAKNNQIALTIGYYETSGDDIFNASMFIGKDGVVKNIYRKRALFGAWEEEKFTRGDGMQVIDYLGVKISFLICFDIEFPELVRAVGKSEADLLIVPTALMSPYAAVANQLVPTRAMENHLFIAYANRVGQEGQLTYEGRSCIIGPDGVDLARAGPQSSQLIYADMDAAFCRKTKEAFNYMDELGKLP